MELLSNGDKVCLKNICDCDNGTPAVEECYTHQEQKCQSCHSNFFLKIDESTGVKTCEPCPPNHYSIGPYESDTCFENECTCQNGNPFDNEDCPQHQLELCKICYCDNGAAAIEECFTDQEHKCQTCQSNHHLEIDEITQEQKCVPCPSNHYSVGPNNLYACSENECKCNNGTPVDNVNCPQHESEMCETCNLGYNFDPDSNFCTLVNVCYCDNGMKIPNDQCNINGEHHCDPSGCQAGYHIVGRFCVINDCFCTNGSPVDTLITVDTVVTVNCITHQSSQCKSCDNGYYLNETDASCDINQCKCNNGVTVEDSACLVNDSIQCNNCEEGYYLSDEPGTLNHCLINKCSCQKGVPVADEHCQEHEAERCFSCNSGYHLEGNDCLKDLSLR